MSFTSTTLGLTQGDFHRLAVLYNGNMTDILQLLGQGGGSGTVTSATLPLSIANGVISVDLSSCIPTTHEANKIGAASVAFGAYDLGAQTLTLTNGSNLSKSLSISLNGGLDWSGDGLITVGMLHVWPFASLSLANPSNTLKALTHDATGKLLWDGGEVQMAANSFTQLSVVAPLTISGSNSVTIDTLWKPSTVTCSAGMVPTANDSLGTLSLDLDFLENRTQVNFIDSQNTVKALTPSITGSLVYGTTSLVDLNGLLS